MSGDGEQPRHYALVLRGLRVWIRLRPGLIIRFNASQLEHAVMYDFQTEPPPASELEGKQHVYGEGTAQVCALPGSDQHLSDDET